MINKNNKRLFSLSAGAMSAMMFMASVSMPVYAAENNIEYVYNQASLDKAELSGYVIYGENGAKLTVTRIDATRNRITIKMELESNRSDSKAFQNDNLDLRVKMNDVEQDSGSGSQSDKGNGKLLIEETIENNEGYPEKGVIRIDAVDGMIGLNGTLKIPVDFTQDFKDVFVKDINKSIETNGIDLNIEKFESNRLESGVGISYSVGNGRSFLHKIHDLNLSFLVNVDGKLYCCNYPHYSYEKDGREYDNYTADGLTYDNVKNADKITIRQLNNAMTNEEIDEFYNRYDIQKDEEYMKSENGMTYPEKIVFCDGSEGNLNVVREEDKVKVYCSSDSELKSMLMAVNLYSVYMNGKEFYDELSAKAIYKDKDKENQYVVEFGDVDKNHDIVFNYNYMIYNIDKYSLGDEIIVK